MITRQEAIALIERMQECFNSRQFAAAEPLHTPAFFSHPLAQDILVDGDKAAVRSAVEGITAEDGGAPPMLFEIFRFEAGRFAEMWGASTDFPAAASPEDLLG